MELEGEDEKWKIQEKLNILKTITQPGAPVRIPTNTSRPGTEKHTTQLEMTGPFVPRNSCFDN